MVATLFVIAAKIAQRTSSQDQQHQAKINNDDDEKRYSHHPSVASVLASFRVAFQRLQKKPRICMEYLEFWQQHTPYNITKWSRLVNQAMDALPVTQHRKLWSVVLKFADRLSLQTTALSLLC